MSHLPECMDDVTLAWLNRAIADHPEFRNKRIMSFDSTPVGEGIGQMSAIARLELAYDGEPGPKSVVVKLHAPFQAMRDVGVRYNMYERETAFYRSLCADVTVPTPTIYFAGWDAGLQRNAMVMQDMSGWYWPDQLAGPTRAHAEACVDALARLGAGHWDADFSDHSWLPDSRADVFGRVVGDYGQAWAYALDRLPAYVTPEGRAACERIAANIGWIFERLAEPPLILTHFDPRLENFVFAVESTCELAMIDWQLMSRLHPGWDIAYFLGTSLPVDKRRQWQDDLMARYLNGLKAGGVRNYNAKQLLNDLRLGSMAMTVIPILGGASFDIGNERSTQLFGAILSRSLTSVLDNDCVALLPT